eukprot:4501302-Pleurochrysis_carterae.AAC.1
MSPLYQLAALFESTPRIPTERGGPSMADVSHSCDDLPMGDDTPGQLQRDLRAVLQSSPHGGPLSSRSSDMRAIMPPPAPVAEARPAPGNKARKRRLEASLISDAPARSGGGAG